MTSFHPLNVGHGEVRVSDDDRRWMLRAIELAALSVGEADRQDVTPTLAPFLFAMGRFLEKASAGRRRRPTMPSLGSSRNTLRASMYQAPRCM